MNGDELVDLALQSCQLRKTFRGVFARDSFMELGQDVTGSFIVNQCDRGTRGLHWLGVYVPQAAKLCCYSSKTPPPSVFFDSLGRGSPQKYKLTIEGDSILHNCMRYQAESSDSCGLFCLYVLHWLSSGVQFENILNEFSTDDLSENDQIVKDFSEMLKKGVFYHL